MEPEETAIEATVGILGSHKLMWASDYPHGEGHAHPLEEVLETLKAFEGHRCEIDIGNDSHRSLQAALIPTSGEIGGPNKFKETFDLEGTPVYPFQDIRAQGDSIESCRSELGNDTGTAFTQYLRRPRDQDCIPL